MHSELIDAVAGRLQMAGAQLSLLFCRKFWLSGRIHPITPVQVSQRNTTRGKFLCLCIMISSRNQGRRISGRVRFSLGGQGS